MYTIKSHDTLMHTTFERISKGIYYDEKLLPFDKTFIEEVIKYFRDIEEYEKCEILLSTISELNHDTNFHKWRQMI